MRWPVYNSYVESRSAFFFFLWNLYVILCGYKCITLFALIMCAVKNRFYWCVKLTVCYLIRKRTNIYTFVVAIGSLVCSFYYSIEFLINLKVTVPNRLFFDEQVYTYCIRYIWMDGWINFVKVNIISDWD